MPCREDRPVLSTVGTRWTGTHSVAGEEEDDDDTDDDADDDADDDDDAD